jgi:hypothetical protein
MRWVVFLFPLWLGCNSAPLDDGNALGVEASDLGKASAVATRDLGGPGAGCQTACDCQAGLACARGSCQALGRGLLYCCESADCPSGSFCQSQSGGFQTCGGGPGPGGGGFGGRDGGPRRDGGRG